MVPTVALANQWLVALAHGEHAGNIEDDIRGERSLPSLVGGGRHADLDQDMLVYVVNSARESLPKNMRRSFALGKHVLLICDECHHYQSKENRKIFDFLRENQFPANYFCLGLSATPFGTAYDEILTRNLGKEIYTYRAKEAAEDAVISEYAIFEIAADFLPEEAREYRVASAEVSLLYGRMVEAYPFLKMTPASLFFKSVTKIARESGMDSDEPAAAYLLATYRRKEISVLAEARIRCAVELIRQMRLDDRILIFCERIDQTERMYKLLARTWGAQVSIYHSKMERDARERVLRDYRDGLTRILVSCKCLDEGLDVPDANVGIVLSSSAVSRQRIQRLGRVIRSGKDKDIASLYYIYIRQASDDAMYLPEEVKEIADGAKRRRSHEALLRYYTLENEFSNELYEYIAGEILAEGNRGGEGRHGSCLMDSSGSAIRPGWSEEVQAEVRRCLLEGLIRPDIFLREDVIRRREEMAATRQERHERNYWKVMRKAAESLERKRTTMS